MNKKTTSVLIVIVVLIIALIGTFAWAEYNQHKTNEAFGAGIIYEVSLTKEVHEISDWKVGDDPFQQEVRVINTGLADKDYGDVFVRVQLKEYMETAPFGYEYWPERLMVDLDGEFLKYTTATEAQAELTTAGLWPCTLIERKNLDDGITYQYVRTKEQDSNGQYGKHLLKGLVPATPTSLIPGVERETDAVAKHHAATNSECSYTVHQWNDAKPALQDCSEVFHNYVSWILGNDVITYEEWADPLGNDKAPIKAWICDTRASDAEASGGWAYWGMPLVPGEPTTDLLKEVELIKQPGENFYYAIHVDMQAVSLGEINGEIGNEWSDAPVDLVNAVTSPIVTGVEITPGTKTVARGGSQSFSAFVAGFNNPSQAVTWSVTGNAGTGVDGKSSDTTINGDGLLQVASGETATKLTVTATTPTGKSGTATVNFSP